MSTAQRNRLLLRLSTRRDVEVMLPIAADLSLVLGLEISALYIEDEETVAACALPLDNVVGFTGDPIPATVSALEQTMRQEAELCEKLLREKVASAGLTLSFRIARGAGLAPLETEGHSGDIVALRADTVLGSWRRTISAAARLAPKGGGALVVSDDARTRSQDAVVAAGLSHEPSPRLQDIAARLRRGTEHLAFVDLEAMPFQIRSGTSRVRLIVTEKAAIDGAGENLERLLRSSRASLLILA